MSVAGRQQESLESKQGNPDRWGKLGIDPSEENDSYRLLRNDRFRELLDEEFQRSYRFETLGNIVNDVKEFFRKVVSREDELGLELSEPPLSRPRPSKAK